MRSSNLLKLFLLSLVLSITSCDVREKDVERLALLASQGHEQSMFTVVNHEKMFKDIVNDTVRQEYIDHLLEIGHYRTITLVMNEEIKQLLASKPNNVTVDERDAIRVKWWNYGIEHGCKKCYYPIMTYYHTKYLKTKNPQDSLDWIGYKQQAKDARLRADVSVEAENSGPLAVLDYAINMTKERLAVQESYSPLHYITTVVGTFSGEFYGTLFSQLFKAKHWWKVLLIFIISLLVLFCGISFCYRVAPRYENSSNAALNGVILGLINSFLFLLSKDWSDYYDRYIFQLSIGRFSYPDAGYGITPWIPIFFTYLFFVWAVVCYDIYHDVRKNKGEFFKVVFSELFVFAIGYFLSTLFSALTIILYFAVFLIGFAAKSAVEAVFKSPGMLLDAIMGVFSPNPQPSSSYESGRDNTSYDYNPSTSSSPYDKVIHGGGSLGEDLKARSNVDGSLTDEHGGVWENDGYGNYSKKK